MAVAPRYITVWAGGPFPYYATLSIASMLQVDEEATVEVHHLVPLVGRPELSRLFSTGRVELHQVRPAALFDDALLEVFERIPESAYAARSNLIRIALLHLRGGVYLDLDTLLVRPLHGLAPGAFVGLERVWRHDRTRVERGLNARHWAGAAAWGCLWAAKRLDTKLLRGRLHLADAAHRIDAGLHTHQLNNAVFGAPAGSELTSALLERARRCDPKVRYALGPALLHDTVHSHSALATIMNPEVLFPVAPSESHRFFDDRTLQLPHRAAVVHYVQSNHRDLLADLRPGDRRFRRPEVFWQLAGRAEQWMRELTTGPEVEVHG